MELFNRIVFCAAHADDVELFSGGVLSRFSREKSVHVLVFSSHRGVFDDDSHEKARVEFIENMDRLGVSYDILDFTACRGEFQAERERIYQTISTTIERIQPSLIITHPPTDTNQDHQQVVAEVLRCAKSRVSIIGGEYPFNEVKGETPDLFVPISKKDIEMKCSLVSNYQSQKRKDRMYLSDDVWKGLARLRGAEIQAEYAEAFYVYRIIHLSAI